MECGWGCVHMCGVGEDFCHLMSGAMAPTRLAVAGTIQRAVTPKVFMGFCWETGRRDKLKQETQTSTLHSAQSPGGNHRQSH